MCNRPASHDARTRSDSALSFPSFASAQNAFSDSVEIDGEAIPQGLPEHVANMWSDKNPQMLKMIIPLARKGAADEAANGMLFLASPLSSYVTGHTLEVTGGFGI